MRRKAASKLLVNWVASFVSVILLLSMMAVPALAVLAANTVNSAAIINGQVRTPDLAGDAVTSAKIKNGQVKRSDIALRAVVSGRIADGAVTTAKIRNGHVRSADIALGAVLSGRIANDAVTSAKIRNGTIRNADIAASASISDSKISYDTTKTGVVSVVGSAGILRDSANTAVRMKALWTTDADSDVRFEAPVSFPDGAVLTKFSWAALDNYAGGDGEVWLVRVNDSNVNNDMASVVSSGNISAWRTFTDTSILQPIVDNSQYSYFFVISLDGNAGSAMKSGTLRVEYEYLSPGS